MEVLVAEVFVEADLVGEAVDLVEVIEAGVREGGLRLEEQAQEGPYLGAEEVLIHIIVIIPGEDIIVTGTCLGIEDGGTHLIGQDIGVVLGIILQHIWEGV